MTHLTQMACLTGKVLHRRSEESPRALGRSSARLLLLTRGLTHPEGFPLPQRGRQCPQRLFPPPSHCPPADTQHPVKAFLSSAKGLSQSQGKRSRLSNRQMPKVGLLPEQKPGLHLLPHWKNHFLTTGLCICRVLPRPGTHFRHFFFFNERVQA